MEETVKGREVLTLLLFAHSSIYTYHRTASDANYWTIRILFIAMTTS